ncbi:MAG: hypothetical protein JWM41_3543 [Gemmatimonadetes bacterium]|nr:hypothetical protein [Gemmatimonadota bacterium]
MGHRAGSAGLPFAAIGAVVVRQTATGGSASLVLAGLVLHVATMFAWSFIVVWLFERAIHHEIVAAVIVAAGEFLLSWIVAFSTGTGLASVLLLGDRLVFSLILAAALVVGMRFAFSRSQNA